MIPVGYLAKRIPDHPTWLDAPHVTDIYSVSDCVNDNFADYIPYWKHNGFWLFDSPELIKETAEAHSINLAETKLFYYEAYELQFDGTSWLPFEPEPSQPTNVIPPYSARLEGFDVVTFYIGTSAEHSPLSCNSIAEEIKTNKHCLFDTLQEGIERINDGSFKEGEPGPHRIYAVYSIDWPNVEGTRCH